MIDKDQLELDFDDIPTFNQLGFKGGSFADGSLYKGPENYIARLFLSALVKAYPGKFENMIMDWEKGQPLGTIDRLIEEGGSTTDDPKFESDAELDSDELSSDDDEYMD